MICSHCGASIPDQAKFCPMCGAKIEPEPFVCPCRKSAEDSAAVLADAPEIELPAEPADMQTAAPVPEPTEPTTPVPEPTEPTTPVPEPTEPTAPVPEPALQPEEPAASRGLHPVAAIAVVLTALTVLCLGFALLALFLHLYPSIPIVFSAAALALTPFTFGTGVAALIVGLVKKRPATWIAGILAALVSVIDLVLCLLYLLGGVLAAVF